MSFSDLVKVHRQMVELGDHPGRQLIMSYLRGEMDREDIAKHLALCNPCANFANAFRAEEVELTGIDPLTGKAPED